MMAEEIKLPRASAWRHTLDNTEGIRTMAKKTAAA